MKTNDRIRRIIMNWMLLVTTGSLLWLSCGSIMGGGEIGNPITITGKVVNNSYRTMDTMRIYLLATENFNPVAASLANTSGKPYEMTRPLAEAVTDTNGEYTITAVLGRGAYHIFGQSADSSVMLYHKITSPDSIRDTPFVDTAVAPGAVIVGIVDSLFVPDGYLFVKGTMLFTKIDSIGRKTIRCPAGTVTLAYCSAASDSILFTIPPVSIAGTPNGIPVTQSTTMDMSALMHRISEPERPAGDTLVSLSSQGNGTPYSTGSAKSNLNDSVRYRFSWGDNSVSPWNVAAGTVMTFSVQWPAAGTYTIRAQARSINDTTVLSAFSDPLTVTVTQ